MVWILIRTDTLLELILVQTICKGYRQTSLVTADNKRVKTLENCELSQFTHICDISRNSSTTFFMDQRCNLPLHDGTIQMTPAPS